MIETKTHKEMLEEFKNSKDCVSREVLLEAYKDLKICHKKESHVYKDTRMVKELEINQNVKILNISNQLCKININDRMKYAKKEGYKKFTNNPNMSMIVKNKDFNFNIEIRKSGIKETFSKGSSITNAVKTNTFNMIDLICEEMIYLETSCNILDKNKILYHHFILPVKTYETSNNCFIRVVVREFTLENKNLFFYFHILEYL